MVVVRWSANAGTEWWSRSSPAQRSGVSVAEEEEGEGAQVDDVSKMCLREMWNGGADMKGQTEVYY